ncbi:MAG: hypothetical protein J0I79_19645 [Mesorhizobium sp.]|uniref:hypothetical protein n=1 Tax=Mesorhizobium sp. TaxID=1871066 RepID=UPI001AC3CEF1|nr:hypothetical protein [Mesorhizobium sp.]MBN9220165.1 hypothetical protein [Mesorhizobium sp.]
MLEAVESRSGIRVCVNLFERKFAIGGRKISGLKHGAIWQERLGVWGYFSESGRRTPPEKYWNVFGQQPTRLRDNMLVEIKPPGAGKNLNRQGVLAKDGQGHRWLLHQGRFHPRGIRVTEEMFDTVAKSKRVRVRYADGTVASCHRVADLDRAAPEVQDCVAAFVESLRPGSDSFSARRGSPGHVRSGQRGRGLVQSRKTGRVQPPACRGQNR